MTERDPYTWDNGHNAPDWLTEWMRRSLGAARYDAFDQSMTGGKTRRYAIRPQRRADW